MLNRNNWTHLVPLVMLATLTGCAGPAYYRDPIKKVSVAADEMVDSSQKIYQDRMYYKHRADVIADRLEYYSVYGQDPTDLPKIDKFASFAQDFSPVSQETAPHIIVNSALRTSAGNATNATLERGKNDLLGSKSEKFKYDPLFNPRRDRVRGSTPVGVGSGALAPDDLESMENLFAEVKKVDQLMSDIAGTDYAGDAGKAMKSLTDSLNTISLEAGGSSISDYAPTAKLLVEAWIQGQQREALHEAVVNLIGPPEEKKRLLRVASTFIEDAVMKEGAANVRDIIRTRDSISQAGFLNYRATLNSTKVARAPIPLEGQLLLANEYWRYENEAADYLDFLRDYQQTHKKYRAALNALWEADQTGDFLADMNAFAEFLAAAADLKEAHEKLEKKR